MISGSAIFFDGKSSARQPVTIELGARALVVRSGENEIASWPYDELTQSAASEEVFRIAHRRSDRLERIEVRDPALARAIDELSLPVDRSGLSGRRGRRRVVLWSMAAVASLLGVGIYGVPLVASQLAPYVPYTLERKLGEAVDEQVRSMLNPGQQGRSFECGVVEAELPGRQALDRMLAKLETAAALPLPLRLKVIRRKEANAMALPGGSIYVFEGLITDATSPDEVGGVIAHEIGHVANRDGMRSVLQAGGLAFVFGLVLGDFVGGGAIIVAARAILQLRYSRQVETDADGYAVALMERVGADGRALGAILLRIAGTSDPGLKILANHPATKERAAFIETTAVRKESTPLLDEADWAALRRICSGS